MGEELAAERQAEMQLERRTRDLKVRLEYMDSFKNVSVVKVKKKKFFLKKLLIILQDIQACISILEVIEVEQDKVDKAFKQSSELRDQIDRKQKDQNDSDVKYQVS